MPRINVDLDYLDHPKVDRLESLLGKGSRALPVWLWLYCGKYHAETGRLIGISATKLEAKILWWGRPGEAVSALLDCGFLEVVDGDYQVHDWQEWQGHIWKYHVRSKNMRAKQLGKGGGPDPPATRPALRPALRPATEVKGTEESPLTPQWGDGDLFLSPEGKEEWSRWCAYRGPRRPKKEAAEMAFLASLGSEAAAIASIRGTMAAGHARLHDTRGKVSESAAERRARLKAEEDERRRAEEEVRHNPPNMDEFNKWRNERPAYRIVDDLAAAKRVSEQSGTSSPAPPRFHPGGIK